MWWQTRTNQTSSFAPNGRVHLTLRRLMSYTYIYIYIYGSYIYIYIEHPFFMFLGHTQRRSTVGRTPLDEWSARRRDLYLTKHDTHSRQISMPPVGFEPTISAGERPAAAHLLRSCVVCDLETSRIGAPYIYDMSNLRVNDLTLILLTWRKWWANNARK